MNDQTDSKPTQEEIEKCARDAAYKIMMNTDAASKAIGGMRFTFQEYQDEVQAVVQEAITTFISTITKERDELNKKSVSNLDLCIRLQQDRDTWAARASQYVTDEQTYGTHKELRAQLELYKKELSSGLCSIHKEPEPLTCSVCNKMKWLDSANKERIQQLELAQKEIEQLNQHKSDLWNEGVKGAEQYAKLHTQLELEQSKVVKISNLEELIRSQRDKCVELLCEMHSRSDGSITSIAVADLFSSLHTTPNLVARVKELEADKKRLDKLDELESFAFTEDGKEVFTIEGITPYTKRGGQNLRESIDQL